MEKKRRWFVKITPNLNFVKIWPFEIKSVCKCKRIKLETTKYFRLDTVLVEKLCTQSVQIISI